MLPPFLRDRRIAPLLALGVALLVFFAGRAAVTAAIAGRIRAAAHSRGADATWRTLAVRFPLSIDLDGLRFVGRAAGDTLLAADSIAVRISPWSLLRLHPRPTAISLAHARVLLPRRAGADPDTLAPREGAERVERHGPAAAKVRRAADALVEALLVPARSLPRLSIRDVTVRTPGPALVLRWLELSPARSGARLAAAGALHLDQRVPFEFEMRYGRDDRVEGGGRFFVPDPESGALHPLRLAVEGRAIQDRRAGVFRIADSTHVHFGDIPIRLSAEARRAGPAFRITLRADSITGRRFAASIPPPMLGPLADVGVRGSWDYRLSLDLDLARPDSVEFHADVIPHGLTLDPARTRLLLAGLDQPFVATVHLPRGRSVERLLSDDNPRFLRLDEMDSLLVHAVLANEDGGFYRHRGFSSEAVKLAIAHNLRVGGYRRGAGTITMQLARNLYLGHEKSLSRKMQEVVLAWVLEHLTGVGKRRLLEIYLNVIEWGPDVHGADEAARYYFDRSARHLSISESLFLTIVIPSPSKWRWRFGPDGELRDFARAQMHFIGRAMVAKGWLEASDLPPPEELDVKIRGPARDVLFPPDTLAADTLSAGTVAPAPPLAAEDAR